ARGGGGWGGRGEGVGGACGAVRARGPPRRPAMRAPLSTPGVIEGLMREAGLTPVLAADVDCPFEFRDVDSAVRCFLSPGLPPEIRRLGDEPIAKVVRETLRPFTRADGSVRQE